MPAMSKAALGLYWPGRSAAGGRNGRERDIPILLGSFWRPPPCMGRRAARINVFFRASGRIRGTVSRRTTRRGPRALVVPFEARDNASLQLRKVPAISAVEFGPPRMSGKHRALLLAAPSSRRPLAIKIAARPHAGRPFHNARIIIAAIGDRVGS